jgi:malate synthase
MRQRNRELKREGLTVDVGLARFVDDEVLPGTGVDPEDFWRSLSDIVDRFAPRNRALLERRRLLQNALDARHRELAVTASSEAFDEEAFLREVGYLVAAPDHVEVTTTEVDAEIATIAGPQLVVPVTNARYALNAANARWGSLYDALYGTDALGDAPPPGHYDATRGSRVIAWVRDLLDDVVPLDGGSHHDVCGLRIVDGRLVVSTANGAVGLVSPSAFVGHTGDAATPDSVVLRHHGLHLQLIVDREHPIGRSDPAGLADVIVESAVSVIMDLEDSVSTVDPEDKVHAYRNWLGLLRGTLETSVTKDGHTFTRRLSDDLALIGPDGTDVTLPGRALMLARNVGLLMDTEAVRDRTDRPIPESILDAVITVACALHDVRGPGAGRNSRSGSIYIVKPKLHGPDEVAFTGELFDAIEDAFALPRDTVKLGIMDEERRTSANLAACIHAVRSRLAFINTGFLDRTGDEIHTSMWRGAMTPKTLMRQQQWIRAYEDRNVDIGLACGLRGRAQIGKGMWAAPDRMASMLAEKGAHPAAGADCAWVPSPTAATLHATHYLRVDVDAVQDELIDRFVAHGPRATLQELLTVPLLSAARDQSLSEEERVAELENNAQGILGYVVRWVDQGIGCSTVPDIQGVGLMEDRATCRISSQLLANWLAHGLTDAEELTAVFSRMAAVVDRQNSGDPTYRPMAPDLDGTAFSAALALALDGAAQPSGYTEPILHAARITAKVDLHGDQPHGG